jgi:DNA repair protein RadA/Sms
MTGSLSDPARTVTGMAKTQTRPSHRCSECGWTTARWVGRCAECQAWGSVIEVGAPKLSEIKVSAPTRRATRIRDVDADAAARVRTGVGELDRVLGDGLVPGAVVLLAGEPGVGKSTLLLEVASQWAKAGRTTLYVTGEESAAQVRLRAGRTNALADELYLAAETDLGTVLGHIEDVRPSLLVVDSVQTVGTAEADGSPGGVTQVREVTGALVRVAKQRGMAVIIIGHVTKDGNIAGPRLLEHLVDVVLAFEGDRHSGFRLVRGTKNRFGPSDEVGCFEMAEDGIVEVADPSGLFTSRHEEPVPGTCVTVTMEGRRPLLAELQALVGKSSLQLPRRTMHGVDSGRLAMVLAVLDRRAGVRLFDSDVYVSTVGGARVADPSADLAAAVAVASSAQEVSLTQRCVAIGEVGLAGELRRVPGLERRLAEAARLGFTEAVVPSDARAAEQMSMSRHGMLIRTVPTLEDALRALGMTPRRR